MQIIPIDTGRSSTKLLKKCFPSVVGDWQERNLSNVGDYEVIINNEERYFVGQLSLDESFSPREMSTKSKIHNETKILFLTALGIVAEEENPIIITGVPINQFKQETKEKMLDLLCGEYNIQVNQRKVHVKINDIIICPESGAIFWYALSIIPELQFGVKRIIDIGSRTINYCTMNNKVYNNKNSNTLDYGTVLMHENKLTNEQFARKIVSDLSKKWLDYDPDNEQVILAGGGALIFGDILKTYYKRCMIVNDPVYANVQGYYRMGVEKWVKQQVAR